MSTESTTASSTDTHTCVLCDEGFDSKEKLQTHFRSHAFDTPLHVQKSKRLDTSSTIYCDVCSQPFTRVTTAIQHKFRKHPNRKEKYHCPSCGMVFTMKTIYDVHVESHQDDGKLRRPKQSVCSTCGAKFDNSSALQYHVKTTHYRLLHLIQPIDTAPPSKKIRIGNAGHFQSVYFCHLCGSEYVLKFNLQTHLEMCHTKEERCATPNELIKCTACDALFYSRKAYESHNVGHKPYDLYATNEQHRLQLVTRIDQDFDARRVASAAEKYLPFFRERRKNVKPRASEKNQEENDELSPPSSPGNSDSDDDNLALAKLKTNEKGKNTQKKTTIEPIANDSPNTSSVKT